MVRRRGAATTDSSSNNTGTATAAAVNDVVDDEELDFEEEEEASLNAGAADCLQTAAVDKDDDANAANAVSVSATDAANDGATTGFLKKLVILACLLGPLLLAALVDALSFSMASLPAIIFLPTLAKKTRPKKS